MERQIRGLQPSWGLEKARRGIGAKESELHAKESELQMTSLLQCLMPPTHSEVLAGVLCCSDA